MTPIDDPRDVYNWILTAIMRNVKEIVIDLSTGAPIKLPSRLYTCETLTTLHLSATAQKCSFDLDFPDKIGLPNLQSLLLDYVFIRDGEAAGRLISGCPSLESLELRPWKHGFDGCLVIKATKLCKLVIQAGLATYGILPFEDYGSQFDMDETKLRLHAPNLEYFWCGDYLIREYTIVEELTHLDFVAIYFEPEGKDRFVPLEDLGLTEEDEKEYLRRALSVVKAVCCANKLRLNAWTLMRKSATPQSHIGFTSRPYTPRDVCTHNFWYPEALTHMTPKVDVTSVVCVW